MDIINKTRLIPTISGSRIIFRVCMTNGKIHPEKSYERICEVVISESNDMVITVCDENTFAMKINDRIYRKYGENTFSDYIKSSLNSRKIHHEFTVDRLSTPALLQVFCENQEEHAVKIDPVPLLVYQFHHFKKYHLDPVIQAVEISIHQQQYYLTLSYPLLIGQNIFIQYRNEDEA